MDSALQKVRREVETLQQDEQSRLDREKQTALDKIRREVMFDLCCPLIIHLQNSAGNICHVRGCYQPHKQMVIKNMKN